MIYLTAACFKEIFKPITSHIPQVPFKRNICDALSYLQKINSLSHFVNTQFTIVNHIFLPSHGHVSDGGTRNSSSQQIISICFRFNYHINGLRRLVSRPVNTMHATRIRRASEWTRAHL